MYDLAYEAPAPVRTEWTCPEEDCSAVLPSPSLLAEHLGEWHGWSEADLSGWWGR